MSATITDQFKRDLLVSVFNRTQNIGTSLGDSDRHFVAIGRSEEWEDEATPPVPYSAVDGELNFRSSVQSMKLVPDVSYVVPREPWLSGNFYSAWDNQYGSNTEIVPGVTPSPVATPDPYYVLTDDNNVFICVAQGRTPSGSPKPSLSSSGIQVGMTPSSILLLQSLSSPSQISSAPRWIVGMIFSRGRP